MFWVRGLLIYFETQSANCFSFTASSVSHCTAPHGEGIERRETYLDVGFQKGFPVGYRKWHRPINLPAPSCDAFVAESNRGVACRIRSNICFEALKSGDEIKRVGVDRAGARAVGKGQRGGGQGRREYPE